jgi:photosystem II stability/assembly factor-like uncharacterized protein
MHLRRVFLLFLCSLILCSISVICEIDRGDTAHFERLGPFGGDVRSLLVDSRQPDTVYLGTSSGKIFKSVDGANSWTPLYPGIGRNGFVVDTLVQYPGEADHIYAGAWDLYSEGGGLFESKNGGLTWTQITLPQASTAIRGLAICQSEPSYMIVGTLSGAYVTSNGGRVWTRVGGRDLLKARSVAIDPYDYRILYVGTWRLAYKSIDFGKTWIRLNKGMPLDSDIFSISVNKQDSRIVYSSACSGVYRSGNRAQSWKRLRILRDKFSIRTHIVFIDPTNDKRVYSGTTEGLFVSENEGRTWKRLSAKNVTVNTVEVDPRDRRKILIGTEYRGILKSVDGGLTWRDSNKGFVHKKVSWILPDPGVGGRYIAGVMSGAGGLYSYDERSSSWSLSHIEPGLRVLSFLILPETLGKLAGTTQGVYWQRARSEKWIKMKGSIARRTVYSLELDPANPVLYAGTDQGIYRTSLEAMNFRMPSGCRLSPKTWCIAAPATSPGLIYAGTSLGLLRSYDTGTTWNVISAYGLPERVLIGALAVSPSDKEHLFAGTSVGLFESQNGGIHWNRVEDSRMKVDISSVLFLDASGARVLAADKTLGGVFYSRDGGERWDKISSPEYESPVNCIAQDAERISRVYIGTQSDGVYRLRIP